MESSILLVGIVLVATILLFVTEWIRIDLVAILASLALAWLGLITPAEAVSGFASNAVITMISVMILGYGIERTGIMSRLANTIMRVAGESEQRITATISLTVGLLSSMMQNVGAAALFLPATRRIGKQTRIPASRLIMPMGFAAILGGCITMIGSGPLIVLNDLLVQAQEEPFSLFAVTPIGIPLLIAGIALFAVAGSRILPGKEEEAPTPTIAEVWGIDHRIRTCTIPPSAPLAGRTRGEAECKILYGLDLLAIRAGQDITVAPPRSTRFEPGQELGFLGSEEDFKRFLQDSGCVQSGDRSILGEILNGEGFGFAELIVRPRASIIGKTPQEILFRQTFSIEPILLQRGETETRGDLSGVSLAAGDLIVAFGSWDTLRHLARDRDLLLISPPEGEGVRYRKGPLAVLIFAFSIALTLTGVPLSLAFLTGTAAMMLSRVLTIDEAYHAIEWKTVILIAGLIPLGIAIEKSGAAALLASSLSAYLSGTHPLVVLVAIAIVATLLSLIISNVAATVLLVPIAMVTGAGTGIDPRALALLVGVCASNSFILPTHQVNALLMGPGGYTTRDYLKAGGIMSVIFIAVAVILIFLLF